LLSGTVPVNNNVSALGGIVNKVITFKTSMFDVSQEEENPINPIYGQSLLNWLKDRISKVALLSNPDAEDWGWYSTLNWCERNYLVGAIAYFEEGDDPKGEIEWILQIDKSRTFKEKLLGQEKLTVKDSLFQLIKKTLDEESNFTGVCVE